MVDKNLKAVILAGGAGTRLSEETVNKPKPLVEIGGKPILWHIMKIFSHFGVIEFYICLGYKGYEIKRYFIDYMTHHSNLTVQLGKDSEVYVHPQHTENWKVHLIDTGENTMTGGRLKRLAPYLAKESEFFFTYGDGVGNVNLERLLSFHRSHGGCATVTSVAPPGRFGAVESDDAYRVTGFNEKPRGDGLRVNGGFFVLTPAVFEVISNDATIWELEPMQTLVQQSQLYTFVHEGFWRPMDTLSDKVTLNKMWDLGEAPWKLW